MLPTQQCMPSLPLLVLLPHAAPQARRAHLWTYGVKATATGSLMGMHALLHMMARTRWDPGPSSSFCSRDGSASGSSSGGGLGAGSVGWAATLVSSGRELQAKPLLASQRRGPGWVPTELGRSLQVCWKARGRPPLMPTIFLTSTFCSMAM